MTPQIVANGVDKFVPDLSAQDKEDLRAYFFVAEKYADEMSEKFVEDLADHPIFSKLIAEMPKELREENNRISRTLQKDAFLNGNWLPYIEYSMQQGSMYARMGIEFQAWYEIVAMARNYLTPYFRMEYGNTDQFLSAVNGLNKVMDIGMSIIGEAYIAEKNEVILKINNELEQRVRSRTLQLESVNKELEAFTYSVSHDLRAPLRAVNGYAEILTEDFNQVLGDDGKRITGLMKYYATKMGTLIDEMLTFSRLGRKEINRTFVDMNQLVQEVIDDLQKSVDHKAVIKCGKLHAVEADRGLLHQVVFNLLSNAVKYSSGNSKPVIELSSDKKDYEIVYSVKDNGVGFDMRYVDKLFNVFQRLHSDEEFEGTGVGLAIVHRIINKHGGRVWAEGQVGKGATFYFALINT